MINKVRAIDTLIIGQGLAGSMLAWQLMQCGQKVMVVGDENSPSASRVAAGLFNPVTGKRLVLQDNAGLIIPAALDLYHNLEKQFNQTLFHEKEMLRIFKTDQEHGTFMQRANDPAYDPYLGSRCTPGPLVKAANGAFIQRKTGYLDTNALLDCMKTHLITPGSYLERNFNYAELVTNRDTIAWHQIHAQRVIFCEGYMAKDNPWFNWLPFQPAKGEILSFTTQQQLPDQIINGGKWLLPITDGNYKTGATYNHDLSSITPTETGRSELIEGMQRLLSSPLALQIVDHQAGVRPNTLDKQPFIGMHPSPSQLGIFNGFGSKGSMLIPYYSACFANHLTKGRAIPEHADISRIQHA